MKKIAGIILFLFVLLPLSGQDLIENIAVRICNCVDTIENFDSLNAKIDRCTDEALGIYFESPESEENEYYFETDTIQKTVDAVFKSLTRYCPKIREFVLAEKEKQYYKMSDSEKANNFYKAGYEAFQDSDYKTAEKQYKKAIKADPGFVYAIDNLALTYRHLKDYKNSVKFYDKSLKIYPEGLYALQNQAVTYSALRKYEEALNNYYMIINLYPDNPEGYFGVAKNLFVTGKYEDALDYAFFAHRIYAYFAPEFVQDSESLIKDIFIKLKEEGKSEVFFKKAQEFGIPVTQ
jgi:tetratricopeptide (TPR) repeat protein